MFKGAGAKPNAVFIRGLTAWMVLENAPAFNPAIVKPSAGPFRRRLEASSGNGMSHPAHHPEAPAKIARQSNGPDLKVTISADAAPRPSPSASPATRTIPGAPRSPPCCRAPIKCFALTDPVTGDVLTVDPRPSRPRHARRARLMPNSPRCPPPAALVITPYADDLSVKVANARVSHHQARRPVAHAAPDAGARYARGAGAFGDEPRLSGFRRLGSGLTGGSFLATERQLIQSAARLPARQGHSRTADSGALLSRQSVSPPKRWA